MQELLDIINKEIKDICEVYHIKNPVTDIKINNNKVLIYFDFFYIRKSLSRISVIESLYEELYYYLYNNDKNHYKKYKYDRDTEKGLLEIVLSI